MKGTTEPKPNVTMYNLLTWGTLYRGYNALIAGMVMWRYMTDPEAAAIEFIPDAAIHAFEAIAPNTWNRLADTCNSVRAIQASYAFFSGNSMIAPHANLIDVFNHGMNVYHRS